MQQNQNKTSKVIQIFVSEPIRYTAIAWSPVVFSCILGLVSNIKQKQSSKFHGIFMKSQKSVQLSDSTPVLCLNIVECHKVNYAIIHRLLPELLK